VRVFLLLILAAFVAPAAEPPKLFRPMDVFDLEWASDPQIAPDGKRVAYVRHAFDVMKDKGRTRIWLIDVTGENHHPLTDGTGNESSPSWSPDGKRVAYVSDASGTPQIHCRWVETGQSAKLTSHLLPPAAFVWSPDGNSIAFSAFVEEPERPLYTLPPKPRGAEWADPPKIITSANYRSDGKGYLRPGHRHLFVIPADGGVARQLTSGSFDHAVAGIGVVEPPSWTPDGKALVVSAKRLPDASLEPLDTELFEVTLADGALRRLTDRRGPDHAPVVSPDGKQIAFLGFDDKKTAYQATRVYVMNRDGTDRRQLGKDFDQTIQSVRWDAAGSGLLVQYPERGDIKVAKFSLTTDAPVPVVTGIGGGDIGRPYSHGSFSVARDGTVAFMQGRPNRPAEVAVRSKDATRRLTKVSESLLGNRSLGEVEEIVYSSAQEDVKIQGWVVKPPNFDPKKKYPLILEIHGGPYADYGSTFAAELQLYAAAGYVVLYTNPRGSTGYGEPFAQQINHNYPGPDYDDLMSGVDTLVKRGFIDSKNLFVTGGSGGGILTAWIVGKTDRFRAAVSAKPIVNWESGTLTTDIGSLMGGRWFSGMPWEKPDEYRKRSPLSLVGNVKTPTMLLTGEEDYRTPMSESEQFYQALKLRKIDTALVRFPGASHAIVDRPSRLLAKTGCILQWFEKYRQ